MTGTDQPETAIGREEKANEYAFTIHPGDTLIFNGCVLTGIAGVATITILTPGNVDRGRKKRLDSKGIRLPRRRRNAN